MWYKSEWVGYVKQVQRDLNWLGYRAGKVDGKFGYQTYRAWTSFAARRSAENPSTTDDAE